MHFGIDAGSGDFAAFLVTKAWVPFAVITGVYFGHGCTLRLLLSPSNPVLSRANFPLAS